jgi:hypothetical protein
MNRDIYHTVAFSEHKQSLRERLARKTTETSSEKKVHTKDYIDIAHSLKIHV